MKTLKEKVLERCGELHDSIIYGNKIEFEWWTFKPQLPMGYVLSGINFTIQVGESVPESDPVWPLAAQVLGIGVEMNFTDALNIFAMAKKAYKMGVENATLAGIDHDKTIEAWFKKQIGI